TSKPNYLSPKQTLIIYSFQSYIFNFITYRYTFPSLAKTTAPTTTAEAAPAFSLGSAATSAASIASTSGFSLTSNTSIGSTSTGLATSVATTTAVSSSTLPTTGMNFRQLEETINKWTVELEEQEKIYLNQATQVNAWDRMLIKNGEKITQLNDSLERVKLEQQHLEHEIDFILAQQKELEDLLLPLEQHVDQTPTLSVQHHADLEREHTYQLAENIDAQMKRMAEDLKEIIDHVNTSNNNQDNTDPVYQVGKILNAHMDSLQWIEQNTNLVQRKLEEVSQLYEVRRKDQERRFRLAYE
uniref:Nucleoporin NSP1-like C-terminal domain-containing protein n=1 Tax=Strigamia maritima TaxID=126957 RepID=T1JM60_STRMM